MRDAILVVNAGSSSIKFAFYGTTPRLGEHAIVRGQVEDRGRTVGLSGKRADGGPVNASAPGTSTGPEARLAWLLDWLRHELVAYRLVGAGHRVVHGGEHLGRPVTIDADVLAALKALIPLARTHEPHEIAAIEALAAIAPEIPQVACFDTAFHFSRPHVDQLFAIPREFADAGIRRYGFHGLSYEHVAGQLPLVLGERADGRVIMAHLGSGASLCAMRGGSSLSTTMGFTALDGLMMSTRCGAIDPGVLLYAIEERGMSPRTLSEVLYKYSGLLGVSGISGDMRELLESTDPRAAEAVELYVYRAVREIGAQVAVLGGLDAIAFSGGVGENSAAIRARLCERLGWLGIDIDAAANAGNRSVISAPASRVSVAVIPADEEGVIARHTCATLGIGAG